MFTTFISKQYERYRKGLGPAKKVQMPHLPKQLEGKYVRGQMYKYQDTLPKLPVPPLEQTLTKYIREIKVGIIGGASAASEATLSSCPLRFVVYVGGFSTCNQSLRR